MSAAGSTAPVALVTGGARGIGAAVGRRLVARGCRVHVLDACLGGDLATRADLDAVVASCADGPGTATGVVADVRDHAGLRAAVDAVVAAEGRLDHVVMAAAVIAGGASVWETDPEELDRLWDTDVRGAWNTAAVTVPHLLAAPDDAHPSLVVVTSAAGQRGLWHLGGYAVVKHAVTGLVRALAADLQDARVTVSGVSPGATATAMLEATARLYGLDGTEELAAGQQQGRVLEPDEVAAVVEFAATGSRAVHGSVLGAEGGFAR